MKSESAMEMGGAAREQRRGASGWKAPPLSVARREFVVVAMAALGVIAGAAAWHWRPAREGGAFPRRESEFPRAAELERRLAEAEAKLQASPEDIRALTESGMLHFQKGAAHYPEAINELDAARKLGSLDIRIFYHLGAMYQEEGLYPFAADEYQKYLRNRPQDVEVRLLLAKLQYQNGQFENAADQYRRLLQTRPKDSLVLENLALCLWPLQRRDEAMKLFNELAARGEAPGRRARFYLGQMAFEDQEYKQALRHFLAVLPVEGGGDLGIPPERIHAAVAANDEKLKLYRDAKEHWEKVLEHHPQNSQAKTSLKAVDAALNAAAKAAARSKKKKK